MSCSTALPERPDERPVTANDTQAEKRIQVRVKNASDRDFDQVRVIFPQDQIVDYGPVPRSKVSDYRRATLAYRYAAVRVTVGERELSIRPIDYLGEEPLSPGRYTYALGIEDERLTLDVEREPR